MPIYQYFCSKCKNKTELIQKISDPPPLCFCADGNPIEMIKEIVGSRITLNFKGNGWMTKKLGE